MRLLRGAPGSKVKITRVPRQLERSRTSSSSRAKTAPAADVTGKIAAPGVGYVRISAVGQKTPDSAKAQIADLTKAGASSLIVDIRRVPVGRSTPA